MGSLIARKKRLMMMQKESILPVGYRKIQYIECNGTQYIITNYSPSVANVEASWTYMFTAQQRYDSMIWGAQGSATSKTWQCEYYTHSRWFCAVGVKQYRGVLDGVGGSMNVKYNGHVDGDYMTVDGQSAQPTNDRTGDRTQYMAIFAWRKVEGGVDYLNKGCRLYSLEFRENGIVAANFVPCVRISDSKPGMYDTVAGTFYTNNGTGEFIIPT